MRRRAYRKVVLRGIRGSLSRFLAIFAIVALGVGFLAGLMVSSPDMRLSVDAYYDESAMMDLRLLSTLGLTERDVDAVRGTEGVGAVMPGWSLDVLADSEDREEAVVRVHSLPSSGDFLNRPVLKEGRMPETAGECVVVRNQFSETPPSPGDVLRLSPENADVSDMLGITELTVTGIVESACYFSIEKETSTVGNGAVSWVVYTPAESFCAEVYTELYVTVVGAAEKNAFSEDYDDVVAAVADRLEALGEVQRVARHEEVTAEARKELDEARETYESERAEAERELADAAQELADGRKDLEDGERELADGRTKYASGKKELEDAEQRVLDGRSVLLSGRQTLADQRSAAYEEFAAREQQIADSREELEAARTLLAEGKAALDEAAAQLLEAEEQIEKLLAAGMTEQAAQLEAALAQKRTEYEASLADYKEQAAVLDESETRLAEGQAALKVAREEAERRFTEAEQTLADTEQQLKAAEAEIEKGRAELAASAAELADAEKTIADARRELADGETAYEKARAEADAQFADAERELAEGERAIADIALPDWYVLDRHTNVSYVSFEGNCSKVEAIAVVFPVFFFLVAALVALTTLTRMVEEERGLIGTMKALGYSRGAIAWKYILYAGSATIAGCLFGLLIGMWLFPTVIWGAYGILYILPPLLTPFNPLYASIAAVAAIACTMLATAGACWGTLREAPARLMMPKAPKAGKRIFLERIRFLWSRLSFTHKVTARNLIRYKKRFFMTVIGIAGCTALLVTGFGLRDSIGEITEKQFGELYQYNVSIGLKEADTLSDEELSTILSDKTLVADYLPVAQESSKVAFGELAVDINLYVPQDAARLPAFLRLRNRKNGETVALTDGAALLTEKAADQLGLAIGDTVTVTDADGREAAVPVGGIVENYVQGYLYMTPALYEQCFGETPDYTMLAAQLAEGATHDALSGPLLKTGLVSAVSFTEDIQKSFSDVVGSIDYIVMVLIICAGLLAFVVLYNLTNINITERQKEIATIKVLGFYDGEVAAYIYRETAILSLIGTVVGLVLGIFLHAFVVRTAEVEMVMFGRSIHALSYILAAVLTLFFSLLVNLVMNRRLRAVDMVESLKAGE